ncbi:hypothetical protein Tco_0782703 [Tanacetum coccineum]
MESAIRVQVKHSDMRLYGDSSHNPGIPSWAIWRPMQSLRLLIGFVLKRYEMRLSHQLKMNNLSSCLIDDLKARYCIVADPALRQTHRYTSDNVIEGMVSHLNASWKPVNSIPSDEHGCYTGVLLGPQVVWRRDPDTNLRSKEFCIDQGMRLDHNLNPSTSR